MSEIKVSIIVPSLNAAVYIGQCLDSIRIQTLPELEILCVDAGSTDGTIDILKEYTVMDSRIRYLLSEQKSYGYQMNMGIAAARGEYIGIVEPDDYVTEEMFEKLYVTAHDNQLDYVKSDFYKFADYRGRRHYQKWERSYWGTHDDVYDKVILLKETSRALVYGDHGNIWSGIYRKDFLRDKKIRFHETPGASYQDTGFALLCTLEAERILFLGDCFYRYRQGGETSVRSQDKHSAIITEYAWIWEQMKSRGFTDEVSRSFYMAMKFHSYLWNCNRLRSESRRCFLKNLVKDEMLEFDEKVIGFQIPEKDRMLRLWRGDWKEADIHNETTERRRRNMEELLDILERASWVTVVSAGEEGVSVLKLYKNLGAENICTICDNASIVQGRSVEGAEIVSVECAVRTHPEAHFIIADKCQERELYEQLLRLGIVPEKIYICSEKVYTKNATVKFLLTR